VRVDVIVVEEPHRQARFGLPSRSLPTSIAWECLLSNAGTVLPIDAPEWNGRQWVVPGLGRGEGRVYRCSPSSG